MKSGATFNKDYFKGLNYWAKLSGADPQHRALIYAGAASLLTSDGKVIPWGEV